MRACIERFMGKIEKTDSCWLWRGHVTKPAGRTHAGGYGIFGEARGKTHWAHRWSYAHFVGPLQPGMHVDHVCRVKNCVNPEHLQQITPQENHKTRVIRPKAKKTHCNYGHKLDASNVYVAPRRSTPNCLTCRRARARRHYQELRGA